MGVGERLDTESKKEEGREVAEGGSARDPKDRLRQLLTWARKSINRYLDQGWHVSLHLPRYIHMAGITNQ